jgi:hypothetical protein
MQTTSGDGQRYGLRLLSFISILYFIIPVDCARGEDVLGKSFAAAEQF